MREVYRGIVGGYELHWAVRFCFYVYLKPGKRVEVAISL